MHRAEKSSSKICRAREVEKAQELHRKKIDGVKSYVYGVISKPAASRSSTSFSLRPARSMMGSFSSITCVQGEPPLNASASTANSGSSAELGHQKNIQSGDSAGTSETWILDNDSSQHYQSLDEIQRSLAKMKEFRVVAPVPGLVSVAPAKPHSIKLVPPPAGPRKKSMNRSVRARHLKEIKHDNAEVFERIRKSVSHYSNDDLRREWQKNVSYLSSISEFPVSGDSLAIGHTRHNTGDGNRSCFGPSPRRSNFLRTTNCPEPLPSIPVIAHPIKCIPTSPKKLQLNMSPAFRSLRKAMPQQPSLPPISSAGGALDVSSNASNIMLLSPRDRSTCPNSPGVDDHFAESTSGRQAPYRSSTALAATKFIGDLHGKQAENEVSGDAKYQLLKTGRFVGGTYLVLTVFCGDGVTNPYGFEVFAYHRELQCEYKLSITKEMTHELLDKSSSSSLAAETAAAAGTNLSMQEIARNICDHINFALLGADQGEMVFLLPNVGRKSDQAMRFDASPGLVAFCLHQTVEIESDEVMSPSNSSSHLVGRKRKAHVFAATCPPKKYPGEVATKANNGMETTGLTICFQIMDTLPPSRCMSTSSEPIARSLSVEASVAEIYDTILLGSCRNQTCIVSMERMVVAAIQHLHIISVPDRYDVGALTNELILNSHVNTLLQPCSSRPLGTIALEKKRSRQQLPHSSSQLFTPPRRTVILIQSGIIWRNCYLLAEIALDTIENNIFRDTQTQRRLIQDTNCDLIVSVFNSNSGHSSRRRLAPAITRSLLERLKTITHAYADDDITEQHIFARQLLAYLQLDVGLFGQEVVVFPALERPSPADGNSEQPEKQSDEGASPEEHEQELSPRTTRWEEENISEGDEDAGSDGYDVEGLDAASNADSLPYNTDEEEPAKTKASHISYTNQDDVGLNESLGDPKTPHPKDEETPENEATSDLRQWRQGRKIDGRFCLLQGASDDTTLSYSIAALGQSLQFNLQLKMSTSTT